ncbi:MAG: hypothetical protein Q9219_002055 [cf. Caloplaca sp. 3 TL-2023]
MSSPPPAPPLPRAYHHPAPLTTLVPHLLPLLPNSLPLLRLIQFHPQSPHARVYATFPPSTTPPSPVASSSSTTTPTETATDIKLNPPSPAAPPPPSFAATYIDRSAAPETECWVFSTYEVLAEHGDFGAFRSSPSPFPTTKKDGEEEKKAEEEARLQIVALLDEVAAAADSPRQRLLIGSLHHALLPLLTSTEDEIPPSVRVAAATSSSSSSTSSTTMVSKESESSSSNSTSRSSKSEGKGKGVLTAVGEPCWKWLIPLPPPPSRFQKEGHTFPPNYHPSTLRRADLPTVLSRTAIPRREDTLAALKSACLRYLPSQDENSDGKTPQGGDLVAWAFLAADGSLTSLHVEEGHRGRGLAGGVVRLLLSSAAAAGGGGAGGEGDEGGERRRWLTSDVFWDNHGGHGVARSVGGMEGWVCRWVVADLGRVREVVLGEEKGGGVEERRKGRK